jgi:hypothetical protein
VDCAGGCFVSNGFLPLIADARKLPRAPSAISGLFALCLRAALGCRAPSVSKLAAEEALLALAVLRKREGRLAIGVRRQGWPLRYFFIEADQDQRDLGSCEHAVVWCDWVERTLAGPKKLPSAKRNWPYGVELCLP